MSHHLNTTQINIFLDESVTGHSPRRPPRIADNLWFKYKVFSCWPNFEIRQRAFKNNPIFVRVIQKTDDENVDGAENRARSALSVNATPNESTKLQI